MKDDVEGDFRKEIYNEIIGQYIRYINNVLFNIGGIYVNEHYEGDPFPFIRSCDKGEAEGVVKISLGAGS